MNSVRNAYIYADTEKLRLRGSGGSERSVEQIWNNVGVFEEGDLEELMTRYDEACKLLTLKS